MTTSVLGRGIYTYAEAAKLTQLSADTVRSWFGARTVAGRPRGRGGVFAGDYGLRGTVSFLDLIEVLVAGHLRELGISLGALRKAHAFLIEHLKTGHPFSHRGLLTDGKKLFISMERDGGQTPELIEVITRQHAIPQILLPYLQLVDYDPTNSLARLWRIADGVIIDPARACGKPIIERCAIPTAVLAAAHRANRDNMAAVAGWFDVGEDDVARAVDFESRFFPRRRGRRRKRKAA